MALLIVGCTVVDIILPEVTRLPAWPDHTEFTRHNLVLLETAPMVTLGGNGANAAYAAARCGAAVTLAGNEADDDFGRVARQWLRTAGCRLAPPVKSGRTAINITAANPRLQRATFFYPGAPLSLPVDAGKAGWALVCGWPHPPVDAAARRFARWRRAGVRIAYDVGPLLGMAPKLTALAPLLASLDLLLANEHELCAITRTRRLSDALARLRQFHEGDVVVKRGAQGALWLARGGDRATLSAGRRVKAVNTVGAGDSFNGALLAALDRGTSMRRALAFANRVAASVVASPRGLLGIRPPARGNARDDA